MKIKGICKDCTYRWQSGAKGQPQHLWCCYNGGRIVKNQNMKSCPHYEAATVEEIKNIRRRASISSKEE